MKRKLAVLAAGTLAFAMMMTGCQSSGGLETEEIKISQYKGVEVDQVEAVEVTEEDIDAAIADVQNTMTIEEDRAVVDGDTVNIAFLGKMDGEAFDGGSSESYDLVIGSGSFIDGFEDSIIGHKVGDEFDWEGVFPETYPEGMAGEDVVFTITVNAIRPELDDAFVQSVSETSKTVDEYREEIRKELEENAEYSETSTLSSAVWEVVLENTEVIKYPEGEVEEYCNAIIDQYKMIAEEYYGTDYETLIVESMNTTVEEFEAEIESQAKDAVKQELVVEAIAEKENIKLDDKTYEEGLQELADANMYSSVDELKESYEEEELRYAVLGNLVGEWLVEHCVQVAK